MTSGQDPGDGRRMTALATIVAEYRKGAGSLRRLSGANASTYKARRCHEARVDHADSALRDAGRHELRGLLAEEQMLADRLAGVDRGDRPELRGRLALIRHAIREELAR